MSHSLLVTTKNVLSSHWFKYSAVSWSFLILAVWNASFKARGDIGIMLHIILTSKVYQLIIFNAALNAILLFGKIIQLVFFGPLLPSERENSRRRVTTYIVFKIVFVLVVLEPEVRSRVLALWAVWFSVLGLFHGFAGLAKDRFQNIVTLTPSARPTLHMKMVTFLFGILFMNLMWFGLCIPFFWNRQGGVSLLLLLTFECFVVFVGTIQTLAKYLIHLYDASQPGTWDRRTSFVYFTDFVLNGFGLSLSDAFIGFHVYLYMRSAWHTLLTKIRSYRAYRRLDDAIDSKFARISEEFLAENECNCAICFEALDAGSARRLPCTHFFHSSCLRQWLQSQSTCPVCRRRLTPDGATSSDDHPSYRVNQPHLPPVFHYVDQLDQQELLPGRQPQPEPQRYPAAMNELDQEQRRRSGDFELTSQTMSTWTPSWFPSFSVQVSSHATHPAHIQQRPSEQPPEVVLDMVSSLREMFPAAAEGDLIATLMETHSFEETVERALSGQLIHTAPPVQREYTPTPRRSPSPSPPLQRHQSPHRPDESVDAAHCSPQLIDTFVDDSSERMQRLQERKDRLKQMARARLLQQSNKPKTE